MRSHRQEFSKATKEEGWERCYDAVAQDGRCEGVCKQLFGGRRPEYHHVLAAALGGDNSLGNMLVVCNPCHRAITTVENVPIFRAKAVEEKRKGIRRSKHVWPKRKMSA